MSHRAHRIHRLAIPWTVIRGLLGLAVAVPLTLTVTGPSCGADSQFQNVDIDVSSLSIPAGADVALTWRGNLDPTYVECRTMDTTEAAGLTTAVTASCWATQSQLITVTATYAGQSASARFRFTSPRPSGSARDYRLLRNRNGQAVKFATCARIPVRLNPGSRPRDPGLEYATDFAVRQVAHASGLRLVYKGHSTFMPRRGNHPPRRGIWIGYAYPGKGHGRSDLLTRGNRDELGIGGPFYDGRTIVYGQLALSRKNIARFGGTPLLIETIMHELAHTVGLDHSRARGGQVMAPVANGQPNVTWGRGDLRGLRKVGPGRTC